MVGSIAARTPFAGRVVNSLHFRRIGHMLAAIVFGLLGALLGTLFSARIAAADRQCPSRVTEAGP
jgi:hypothetical protein